MSVPIETYLWSGADTVAGVLGNPDSFASPSTGQTLRVKNASWRRLGNKAVLNTATSFGIANFDATVRTGVETGAGSSSSPPNDMFNIGDYLDIDGITSATGTANWFLLFHEQDNTYGANDQWGAYLQATLVRTGTSTGTLTLRAGFHNGVNSPAGDFLSPTTRPSIALNPTLPLIIKAELSGGAPGVATTISATVIDRNSGSVLMTATGSIPYATQNNVGRGGPGGFSCILSGGETVATVNSFQLLYTSTSNLSCNSSTVATSTTHVGLRLTGVGTNWLTSNPIFALSGVAGVTKTSQHILGNTDAIVWIDTGVTAGTLTVTDSSQATLNTCQMSITATPPVATLSADQPRGMASNSTTAKLSFGPAGNAAGTITYTVYRGRTSTFVPGGGGVVNLGSSVVSFNATTGLYEITDTTLSDNKLYCYRVVATDNRAAIIGSGVNNTGSSKASPTRRGYLGIRTPPTGIAGIPPNLEWVKIGDSIATAGTGMASNIEIGYIVAGGATGATFDNRAQGGSRLYTMWDPTVGGSLAAGLAVTLQANGVTLASIGTLGINDSNIGLTTKAQFKGSALSLITDMAAHGIIVLWHTTLWNMVDSAANDRLIEYEDAIDELCVSNPTMIKRGSLEAIVAFAGRADLFADSLHPNAAGHAVLGAIQASGDLEYLQSLTPPINFRGENRIGYGY